MKKWILATDRELFMKNCDVCQDVHENSSQSAHPLTNKRRENHARHTILKIATLDQLQRKFSYNHCLIIILLKLRGL